MNKNIAILIAVVVLVGAGVFFYMKRSPAKVAVTETPVVTPTETAPVVPEVDKTKTVIGKSVEGRDIIAYHFGTGAKELLFVGALHGGYEWNTALVAYDLIDYLKANPAAIPSSVKVTVIPVANPDGLNKVVGTTSRFAATDVSSSAETVVAGRFNGNTVDLNRNFDCDWQASGKWQTKTVSGGSAAFSEPESLALKNYIESHVPAAAVVYYSSAGGVFASSCHDGVLADTRTITNVYAKASGYPAYEEFNYYEITGDMVNWLAKQKIPAISVLLTNHESTEWTKNRSGIDALLKHYGN